MAKLVSLDLDLPSSSYEFYKIAQKFAKNRNKGGEGQRQDPTRQRLPSESPGFPAEELDDGEVSAATKATIVLFSFFRVD